MPADLAAILVRHRRLRRRPRDRRARRSRRRARDPRRPRPSIPVGVGDQAVHGDDGPDRGRPRPARSRRAGRPAGLDRQAPPGARVRPPVRGRGACWRRPAASASTRTRATTSLGDLVVARDRQDVRDRRSSTWVLRPLAMDRTFLDDRPSEGLAGSILDLATFARELLRPTLLTPACAASMRDGGVPGDLGRGARHRPIRPVRLGPRRRAPRRQATALDGRRQQSGDIRPLRRCRHVPVGGPGRGSGPCRADRSRLRRLGARRLAGASPTRS